MGKITPGPSTKLSLFKVSVAFCNAPLEHLWVDITKSTALSTFRRASCFTFEIEILLWPKIFAIEARTPV